MKPKPLAIHVSPVPKPWSKSLHRPRVKWPVMLCGGLIGVAMWAGGLVWWLW